MPQTTSGRPPRHAGEGWPAGILLRVSETAVRLSCRDGVRVLALLLSAASFVAGVYFALWPRDRHDVVSAAGVAAAALLSAVTLAVPATGMAESFLLRLRRIALYVNTILVAIAVVIVALEGARDWRRAALHGGLLVPPLVTIVALRARSTVPRAFGKGPGA